MILGISFMVCYYSIYASFCIPAWGEAFQDSISRERRRRLRALALPSSALDVHAPTASPSPKALRQRASLGDAPIFTGPTSGAPAVEYHLRPHAHAVLCALLGSNFDLYHVSSLPRQPYDCNLQMRSGAGPSERLLPLI